MQRPGRGDRWGVEGEGGGEEGGEGESKGRERGEIMYIKGLQRLVCVTKDRFMGGSGGILA